VNVKDKGNVPINQLKIGDFVKNGKDDSYTKVYGFGHYDPDREEEFQQIHFVENNKNSSHHAPPLEVTSVCEKKQKTIHDSILGHCCGG
jgi:hypothetical protein